MVEKQVKWLVLCCVNFFDSAMPGKNCCIPQCTVSQTLKHKGIRLYQVSTRKDEFYTKLRKEILAIISRYRVFDTVFKARVENGRAFICEKHYKEEDFEKTSKYIYLN